MLLRTPQDMCRDMVLLYGKKLILETRYKRLL